MQHKVTAATVGSENLWKGMIGFTPGILAT
jgi:hypothetical protein